MLKKWQKEQPLHLQMGLGPAVSAPMQGMARFVIVIFIYVCPVVSLRSKYSNRSSKGPCSSRGISQLAWERHTHPRSPVHCSLIPLLLSPMLSLNCISLFSHS